jgi:hypothetical protein
MVFTAVIMRWASGRKSKAAQELNSGDPQQLDRYALDFFSLSKIFLLLFFEKINTDSFSVLV